MQHIIETVGVRIGLYHGGGKVYSRPSTTQTDKNGRSATRGLWLNRISQRPWLLYTARRARWFEFFKENFSFFLCFECGKRRRFSFFFFPTRTTRHRLDGPFFFFFFSFFSFLNLILLFFLFVVLPTILL